MHTSYRNTQGLLSLYLLGAACIQWKIEGGGILLSLYAKLLSPEVLFIAQNAP